MKSLALNAKILAMVGILVLFACKPLHSANLGIAMSGGGARGFAHIGVLKVLEEEGIRPSFVTGSSIGAIIGALYSMGYSPQEIENICLQIDWDNLTRDVHQRKELYIGQKRWTPYGNVNFELNDRWVPQLPSSVFVGNQINLELFRITAAASQVKNFSQLPISFACNATNLLTGEPVTFQEGSLMQALRASMSIPSLVKPFEVDGNVYIDGGVSQNMPIDLLKQLGADCIIGIKVNSKLRSTDRLNNLVDILDQTINIGITRNLNEHLDLCDVLIEPGLTEYLATDYQQIREIIKAGEISARTYIDSLRCLKAEFAAAPMPPTTEFNRHKDKFFISSIEVIGNKYISAAKIKEYLGLDANKAYSTIAIYKACQYAWNSQVFQTIYPVLEPDENGSYILCIHVKEKDRKEVALNLTYSSDDQLNAGLVLSLNNYILKNSRLLAELKLGGKNELNVDYVKNFGEQWGAYYRLFSYVNEKTIYNYEDHHKVNSTNSLDWGTTSGIGIFAKNVAIAEMFIYSNQTRLYNEISPTPSIPQESFVSGFGIKGYHESLDDYIFPTRGLRFYNKFNFSRNVEFSDVLYSSFQGRWEACYPVLNWLSCDLGLDYGSYFNSATTDQLDPFIIGGTEGFLGYSRYEISAPHYQIVTFGLSSLLPARFWLSLGSQALRYSDTDVWGIQKDWEYCAFVGLGYRSIVLPVKLLLAVNEAGRLNSQLSIGYDFDIFKFSRK